MIDVPSNAKVGDFGLVRMGGQGGKWIGIGQSLNDILTGQKDTLNYQHAFVYVGDSSDFRPYIVEAMPNGAVKVPFHYGTDVLWSSGIIDLTDGQRACIAKAANGYIGVGYSWADYAALAAHTLGLSQGDALRDFVKTSKHMMCSQLVDQTYVDCGKHLFTDKRWPGYVPPNHLATLLRTHR